MQLVAQNYIKPASIGIHYSYTDFETAAKIKSSSINTVLKNNQWAIPSEMMSGFGIDFFKGITPKIDFVASMNYTKGIDAYNLPNTNLNSYSLFTVDALLNVKLVSDKYYVRPYLISGVGLYKQNGIGMYAPLGMGLQFNVFNAAILNLQTQYQLAFKSGENSNIYYQIGFATSIAKKKIKSKDVEPLKVEPAVIPIPVTVAKNIFKDLKILVVDEETLLPLPQVQLTLHADSSNTDIIGKTDQSGQAEFDSIKASHYFISGMLHQINTNVDSIGIDLFNTNTNPISITLKHHDPRFTLVGIAKDNAESMPVGNAVISVMNLTKNTTETVASNIQDGTFQIQLESNSDFSISGKKNSYLSNIEKTSTKGLNRSTTLYVNLVLDIQKTQLGHSIVMNKIYFETGKSELNKATSADLNKLVLFLNDNPDLKLEISGHTDNSGSQTINNRLSYKRAKSILDYLVQSNIDAKRLTAIGYGSAKPIETNDTSIGKSKNRRVEIKVVN